MGRQLKLQLQDAEGKVLKNQTVSINNEDLLIVKFPMDVTADMVEGICAGIAEGLEEGGLIAVPDFVDFVLVKKEEQSKIQTAPSGLILP
jgi:hypothetical protein